MFPICSKISTILVIFTLLQFANTKMCSVFCTNQSCATWTSNTCTTCFSPDFTKDPITGLCVLTTASGWSLVDMSIDAGGSIASNNTSNSTCGTTPWRYKYYGLLTGTAKIKFTDSTGPIVPYYQIRIIVWIILLDGWANTDMITVTFNTTKSLTQLRSNFTSNEALCSGAAK